jgi:hypothetical protein
MARHHLSKHEEMEGGKHSHMHPDHHHKAIKHHMSALHKMAKDGHKHHSKHGHHHITAHDKAMDRKNLAKARHAK